MKLLTFAGAARIVLLSLGTGLVLGCSSRSTASNFDPVQYSQQRAKMERPVEHRASKSKSEADGQKYYVFRDENGNINSVPIQHRSQKEVDRLYQQLNKPIGSY